MKKVIAVAVAVTVSGCAAPLLLGVKSYETKNSRTEFITGADFTFGLNGTDTVDNKRGIKPTSTGMFKPIND